MIHSLSQHKVKQIGYIQQRYPEQRCIIDRVSDCTYQLLRKRYPLPQLFQGVLAIARRAAKPWDVNAAASVNDRHVDLVHTFNTVCLTRRPWCAMFESTIPRTDYTVSRGWLERHQAGKASWRYTRRLLRRLQQPNCLALMALSRSAFLLQQDLLQRSAGPWGAAISNKMMILHPPQACLIDEDGIRNKFRQTTPLKFIFIGHDFFRKGGSQVVDGLSRLAHHHDIELTLVSKMQYGDYASASTAADALQYRQKINGCSWIRHFEDLPHDAVLQLCREAHIGLLPTLADTYGYAVLEMQACGCPVITTDIRALPEINNETCGWLIRLPQDKFGEATYQQDRKNLLAILDEQLDAILQCLPADKSVLQDKAIQAWQRIRQEHDPDRYASQLRAIYDQADNSGQDKFTQ